MPSPDAMPHAAPGDVFDPDAEALALARRVIAKARVARSLLRLAATAATHGARQAVTASAAPEIEPLRALARAAGEATVAEIARLAAGLDALARPRPDRAGPAGTATPPARVSPEGGAPTDGG
jgi:hypothetical protein